MTPRRVEFVFPRLKLLSGAERSILGLAGALADEGHRPRVICHQFDPSCRAVLRSGVALHVTGKRLDWFRNRYLNAAVEYARSLQLRRHLDPAADAWVVCGGPSLPIAWWAKRRGVRSAPRVVYHCFEPPRALYQDAPAVLARVGLLRWLLAPALRLYRRIDRRLVGAADALTTVGPYPAARIYEVYGREAVALTHGFDRDGLDGGRSRAAPRDDDAPMLLTVNYLHPRKRIDLVIEALARLRSDGLAVRLRIVGDGPERDDLERLAASLGVSGSVEFAGFVPEDELGRHYWEANCYVHAARDESLGLSVIEAAYCELPIVATAEGGVVDNVEEGVSGHLVTADVGELAAAVRRILRSPDRGRAMGRSGRERIAARYSWARGARELLSTIAARG